MAKSKLLTISSVVAETVAEGTQQIVARWKDSEKRTISKENRNRAIILPDNIWHEQLDAQPSKNLRLFVSDALTDLAREYLSKIVEDSNWMRTEVPQEDFTVSALLTWQEERAALSGRLNSDTIKEWLTHSATVRTVQEKHGKEVSEAFGAQLVKLAGPNHGLTAEKAGKILANLWDVKDSDSNTGFRVQLRLEAISKKKEGDNLLADLF